MKHPLDRGNTDIRTKSINNNNNNGEDKDRFKTVILRVRILCGSVDVLLAVDF